MLLTHRNKRELWLGSTARDGFPVLLSVAACLPFFNQESTYLVTGQNASGGPLIYIMSSVTAHDTDQW